MERIRRWVGMSAILDYNSLDVGGASRSCVPKSVRPDLSRGRLPNDERPGTSGTLAPTSLLQRNQRDRGHGGEDAGSFPSGELFFEKEAGQQDGQGRIK